MLYYNSEESALRSVLRWQFTLSAKVLSGCEWWFYNGLAVTCTLLIDYGVLELGDGVKSLNIGSLLGPVMTLAVFTGVFFNGQCYSRYLALYSDCMSVDTGVKMLINEILVDFSFDRSLRNHTVRIAKYIIASIFVFHLGLEGGEQGMSDEQWQLLIEKGLLNEEEVSFIRAFPCHNVILLHYWAMKVVNDCVDEAAMIKKYSPPERAALTSRIYGHISGIGQSCRSVSVTLNLPIPFAYFHLLQICISSSLLITGICVCVLSSNASGPTYCTANLPFAVMSFVMLGLRQLSSWLADPFGHDDVDFPTADFMRETYDHSVAMLLADLRFQPTLDLATTSEIKQEHVERPCNWMVASLKEQVSRYRDDDVGDDTKHGTRLWHRPEDVFTAARVGRWFNPSANDGVGSKYRKKIDDEPMPPRTDELQLAVLERLDSKIGQLLIVSGGTSATSKYSGKRANNTFDGPVSSNGYHSDTTETQSAPEHQHLLRTDWTTTRSAGRESPRSAGLNVKAKVKKMVTKEGLETGKTAISKFDFKTPKTKSIKSAGDAEKFTRRGDA